MIGIYKVVSPTNRVYIGQSRNIKKRISNYKCLDCKKQKRLYASFLKYGVHNHKFEILEECTIDNLNTKERYYQDLYEVLSVKGLNCTLTRNKISISGKGRKPSDNQKQAVKLAIGRKLIDTESGIIYDSIKECALAIGIKANNLGRYLNSKRKNKTKIKFYENTL